MGMRVEHNEAAELEVRRFSEPGLTAQPEWLRGIGTLKDYQVGGRVVGARCRGARPGHGL